MIVSVNSDPHRSEFNLLLSSTIRDLQIKAENSPKHIASLLGRNLEPYVKNIMTELAVGTPFENSIELTEDKDFLILSPINIMG